MRNHVLRSVSDDENLKFHSSFEGELQNYEDDEKNYSLHFFSILTEN